jgi:hypothetical protein
MVAGNGIESFALFRRISAVNQKAVAGGGIGRQMPFFRGNHNWFAELFPY